MAKKYDFGGWATKNNILCSDGRTIMQDAFLDNDGAKVPLVWNHNHHDPSNVLGHAYLENRDDGVYAYCTFNDTEAGKVAKQCVMHGDVNQLSIRANQLKQQGGKVLHGLIREVSLVLAGANPGAFIDDIVCHGEGSEAEIEAIIYSPVEDNSLEVYHSEETADKETVDEVTEDLEHSDDKEDKPLAGEPKNEKTVKDVINTMNEEQQKVLFGLIGERLDGSQDEEDEEDEGDEKMKHNVFDDSKDMREDVLSHSDMELILSDAKRLGSLRDSVLQHGITNIDYLFPDAQNVTDTPGFIAREQAWVSKVMSGVKHTPFSRIKSMFADITSDEARAKGYTKGNLKVEEVFSLLKRTTSPTTIYKKQKLDRDDIVDITNFDVVAWLKTEMRMMLDEEIARAILVGDGRLASSDDHINDQNIRPIWTDAVLYTIPQVIPMAANASDDDKAKALIRKVIKSRKDYKGSGNITFFTTEDVVTDCLLLEDTTGRRLYNNINDVATALRVKEIIPVPVMEGLTRTVDGSTHTLMGIAVDLNDYNLGVDKGGAVSMFDDFDIDYNQQKYLIETRCSGALVKPHSALVFEWKTQGAAAPAGNEAEG